MAGSQGSALAVAVSNAGGLGSLPCAMLSLDAMGAELTTVKKQTDKPDNMNFFCHTPPVPNAEREAAWRAALTHRSEARLRRWDGKTSGEAGERQ